MSSPGKAISRNKIRQTSRQIVAEEQGIGKVTEQTVGSPPSFERYLSDGLDKQ
jgi:hypothetical protein